MRIFRTSEAFSSPVPGSFDERDPPPDAAWRAIADRAERLATGLRAIYDWYQRHAIDVHACCEMRSIMP